MGNTLSDGNILINSQEKYLEANEIISLGYKKRIDWDNVINKLAEKDEKINYIITEKLILNIINGKKFEDIRKQIKNGITAKLNFQMEQGVLKSFEIKYKNSGYINNPGCIYAEGSGYRGNNYYFHFKNNSKINKFENDSNISYNIFLFFDSNFVFDKNKTNKDKTFEYPGYFEFDNNIKAQINDGKPFMIYNLATLSAEQHDKGIKSKEKSLSLLETDSKYLIKLVGPNNPNLILIVEIVKNYFTELATKINDTVKNIVNSLAPNERAHLKNIQTISETIKYLKFIGKYNIESLSDLHLSKESKEKLLYKQIRKILTKGKELDFGADYILTICGICINLFSENRSLIISSDCDLKIISDLIYNEIFPRYYAEVVLNCVKKNYDNTTDFIKYLESIGYDNQENYKKKAINDSKIHMKYCYLDKQNYLIKEKILHIFNPKENRLYIYDIIWPLKKFLIGIDDFIHGKSKIIIYSIEYKCNPIDILVIIDYLKKENIYESDNPKKFKLLLGEILRLKGNKENFMEVDKKELEKIINDYFPKNKQNFIESVKSGISKIISS